jgi:long-chain fatty acid transport protein
MSALAMEGIRRARRALILGAVFAVATGAASAGGYDTGERDWDFLFGQDDIVAEASIRYIAPQRTLTGITGVFGPSADTDETEAFAVPRASISAGLGSHARCMASYREPWGGHANYGTAWTYAASATEQHFSSKDYGVTCSAYLALGKGQLHFLGGASYQEIDYELIQAIGPGLSLTTNVGDSGTGWRAGLAYEIPEYALRASLIYNSRIDYRMTGTVAGLGPAVPVFGDISMPQSAELKVQSGIAPGWLAFGSVRWTDWSVVGNMPLCPVGTPVCGLPFAVSGLTLIWKDTWTVTVGAAHQFSGALSVAANLTWDQGATQGFTSQTDTWVAGLTAIVKPHENVELRLGGTAGILTGGQLSTMTLPGGFPNPVGYTAAFGDDFVYSLNASAAIRF